MCDHFVAGDGHTEALPTASGLKVASHSEHGPHREERGRLEAERFGHTPRGWYAEPGRLEAERSGHAWRRGARAFACMG